MSVAAAAIAHGWGGELYKLIFSKMFFTFRANAVSLLFVIIQIAFSFMRNAITHAQIKDTIGLYTQQLIDSSFVSHIFSSNPE